MKYSPTNIEQKLDACSPLISRLARSRKTNHRPKKSPPPYKGKIEENFDDKAGVTNKETACIGKRGRSTKLDGETTDREGRGDKFRVKSNQDKLLPPLRAPSALGFAPLFRVSPAIRSPFPYVFRFSPDQLDQSPVPLIKLLAWSRVPLRYNISEPRETERTKFEGISSHHFYSNK